MRRASETTPRCLPPRDSQRFSRAHAVELSVAPVKNSMNFSTFDDAPLRLSASATMSARSNFEP